MEKFIPYEKLSKKEKRKMDQARRQTCGELNPVTGQPVNSKAYNRNKTRNWIRENTNRFRAFLYSSIVIFLSLLDQENCRYHNSHQLCYHNGVPNTINIPNQGQQHNRCNLEHQRSQEGNDCGRDTVVERGEKTGTKNGIAHKEK